VCRRCRLFSAAKEVVPRRSIQEVDVAAAAAAGQQDAVGALDVAGELGLGDAPADHTVVGLVALADPATIHRSVDEVGPDDHAAFPLLNNVSGKHIWTADNRGRTLAGVRGIRGSITWVAAIVVVACQPTVSPLPSFAPPASTATAAESADPTATPRPTPTPAPEPLWEDVTEAAIGQTAEWTNKVEIADLDGDELPDLLFANGGLYEEPGSPEPARVFRNLGTGRFEEATETIFGDERFLSRAIKVGDLDADGDPDILVTGTFQTSTRLFLGDGSGAFTTAPDQVPAEPLSIGDVEFGDVDADGDLDLMLAEWGAGSPMANAGGRTRLWLNDGAGRFADATDAAMPDVLVRFSWELELLDVDGDWDLDAVISCKQCAGSFLFENDGAGAFTDVTAGRLPQFPNNYEFEAMDVDGDADLDLVTINDGTEPPASEHLFLNDGAGSFSDATPVQWPVTSNPGFDDNNVAFLDVESDGDADFVIGSLDGPDRLLVNDGTGSFTMQEGIIDTDEASGGTLAIAVADLDLDGRLDLVEGQGEVPGHENERVYLGTRIGQDTAPPSVTVADPLATEGGGVVLRARIHDRISPARPIQLQRVIVRSPDGDGVPMTWYGEYLWQVRLDPASPGTWAVCAADASGNETCADAVING